MAKKVAPAEAYKTVKECHDPRNGIVAIFYGVCDEGDKPGFWVEAQRVDFYSDYVSESEAEELYEYYSHSSQRG